MKICKGGITRNIDEKRWPEFLAKGYKKAEEEAKGDKTKAKGDK